jgi:hypothetical protein
LNKNFKRKKIFSVGEVSTGVGEDYSKIYNFQNDMLDRIIRHDKILNFIEIFL